MHDPPPTLTNHCHSLDDGIELQLYPRATPSFLRYPYGRKHPEVRL